MFWVFLIYLRIRHSYYAWLTRRDRSRVPIEPAADTRTDFSLRPCNSILSC